MFIGNKSLSFDEGVSIWFAGLGWHDLWNSVHQVDAVLASYYAVLHIWMSIFGFSPAAARSLSAASAVAMIPCIYLLARKLTDRETALLATLFAATSVFVVTYAQTARPYALEMFSSTLSLLAFVHYQKRPTRLAACAYMGFSVAAIYLHAFAGLMIVAQLISLPLLTSSWRKRVRVSIAMVLVLAILYVPVAIVQLGDGIAQIDWIPHQDIVALGRPAAAFAGSIPLVIAMILSCTSLMVVYRQHAQRSHLGALLIWFGVPIALGWIISLYHPVFLSRYFASAYPAFVILIASGVRSMRPVAVSAFAATLIVALSVDILWTGRNVSNPDIRGAALFIAQHATGHDAVVIFPPTTIFAFREELEHHRSVLRAPIIYPPVTTRLWYPDLQFINPISFSLGRYAHVWVLSIDLDRQPCAALMAHLREKYVDSSDRPCSDVAVRRLDLERPRLPGN